MRWCACPCGGTGGGLASLWVCIRCLLLCLLTSWLFLLGRVPRLLLFCACQSVHAASRQSLALMCAANTSHTPSQTSFTGASLPLALSMDQPDRGARAPTPLCRCQEASWISSVLASGTFSYLGLGGRSVLLEDIPANFLADAEQISLESAEINWGFGGGMTRLRALSLYNVDSRYLELRLITTDLRI